jgi:hypothetical protein
MAGRVPAIRRDTSALGDGRDKPGHDGERAVRWVYSNGACHDGWRIVEIDRRA